MQFNSAVSSMDGSSLAYMPAHRLIVPKVIAGSAASTVINVINTSTQELPEVVLSIFDDSGVLRLSRLIDLTALSGFSNDIGALLNDGRPFSGYAVVENASDSLIGFET